MADEQTLGAEEQAFAQLLSADLQPEQQPQSTDDNNYYGLGLKKDQALAIFKAIDPELDDFPKLREVVQQHKEYRSKIQEYERNPTSYANELVQELDSMYKEGASDEDVDNFLRVQRMDISKMQDLDAVKTKMKMEHPSMTDEMVEGILQEEFGGDLNYEEMTPLQKGKLTIKAKEAKEFIAKRKKEVKASTAGANRKQQQEAINAKTAQWLKVINVFLASIKEFPIPLALKDKKPFAQIKIPLLPEFKQQLAFQVAQFALNRNLIMDKSATPLIQDFLKRSMYFSFGDYIVEETIKHASDEKLRTFHNINNPYTPAAETTLTKTEQEKIAKQINDLTLGSKP